MHRRVRETRGSARPSPLSSKSLSRCEGLGRPFSLLLGVSRPEGPQGTTEVLLPAVLMAGEMGALQGFEGLSALFEETCMSSGAAVGEAETQEEDSEFVGCVLDPSGPADTPRKERTCNGSAPSGASSVLGDSPATLKRALTDEEIHRKVCVACGFKMTEKSPLCRDQFREWPPSFDYYGDMCRYCWSLMRVRYTNQTPASMPQFLAVPENQKHFELYLVSWFSLKLDGTCSRITSQALEARSRLISLLKHWVTAGRSIGVPAWNPPMTTRLLAEHVAEESSNPLLLGGTLVQMLDSQGHLRAGIRMPVSQATRQSDLPKFPILDPSSPDFAADVRSMQTEHSIIDDTSMYVTVEDDQQLAQGIVAEWRAIRAAQRQAGECSSNSASLAPGAPLEDPQSGMSIVRFNPMKRLSSSMDFVEADDAKTNDMEGGGASEAPASKKRKVCALTRKADALIEELAGKIDSMGTPQWKQDVLERALDGLCRRFDNHHRAALEKQDFTLSARVEPHLGTCRVIHTFLSTFKKTLGKSDADPKVLELGPALVELKESLGKHDANLSPDLELLLLRYAFLRDLGSRPVQAFKLLSLDEAQRVLSAPQASVYSESSAGANPTGLAVDFVFPIHEKAVVDMMRRLPSLIVVGKQNTKQQFDDIKGTLEGIAGVLQPYERIVSATASIPYRAGLFVPQINALVSLMAAVSSASSAEQGQCTLAVKPSSIRDAINLMLAQPTTQLGEALSAYAGCKAVLDTVRKMVLRTSMDDLFQAALAQGLEVASMAIADCGTSEDFLRTSIAPFNQNLVKVVEMLPKLTPVVVEESISDLRVYFEKLVGAVGDFNKVLAAELKNTLGPLAADVLKATRGAESGGEETDEDGNLVVHLASAARKISSKAGLMTQLVQTQWQAISSFMQRLEAALGSQGTAVLGKFVVELAAVSNTLKLTKAVVSRDQKIRLEELAGLRCWAEVLCAGRRPLEDVIMDRGGGQEGGKALTMEMLANLVNSKAALATIFAQVGVEVAGADAEQKGCHPIFPEIFLSDSMTALLEDRLYSATAGVMTLLVDAPVLKVVKPTSPPKFLEGGSKCEGLFFAITQQIQSDCDAEVCEHLVLNKTCESLQFPHEAFASRAISLVDACASAEWVASPGVKVPPHVFIGLARFGAHLSAVVKVVVWLANFVYPGGTSRLADILKSNDLRPQLVWGTVAANMVWEKAGNHMNTALCQEMLQNSPIKMTVDMSDAHVWLQNCKSFLSQLRADIAAAMSVIIGSSTVALRATFPSSEWKSVLTAEGIDNKLATAFATDPKLPKLNSLLMTSWGVVRDCSRDAHTLGFELNSHRDTAAVLEANASAMSDAKTIIGLAAAFRVLSSAGAGMKAKAEKVLADTGNCAMPQVVTDLLRKAAAS